MKEHIDVDTEYLTYLHREIDKYRKDIWERTRGFREPCKAQENEYDRLKRLYDNARSKLTVFKKHNLKDYYAMCLVDFMGETPKRHSYRGYHC